MTLFKSLILGSAAGIVAVAGAQAADLPVAEPVEYVKVCDTYGAGFFYIPGGETCLKISGMVRADYVIVDPRVNRNNFDGFRSRGRVNFDARTATEYGLLRSYIRYQFERNSAQGNGSTSGSPQGAGVDMAYIQFAGLTAGWLDSFFDFKPYPSYAGMYTSDIQTSVLAYTAQFGNGFSATIAIEDGTWRKSANMGEITQAPNGISQITTNRGVAQFMPYDAAGQRIPDVVGQLRLEQGWGEAQLSGAYHQLRNTQVQHVFKQPGPDEAGFAVQGGVLVKLPMIAEDDYAYASGAYSDGALSYTLSGIGIGCCGNFDIASGVPISDFISGPNNNKIQTTKSWNVNAGFEHHINENWRATFSGSYVVVDYARSIAVDGRQFAKTGGAAGRQRTYDADWSSGVFAGQLIWTPVKGLDIGAEVDFTDFFDRPEHFQSKRGGYTGARGSDEVWSGRLRVQRDF
jgi:hypothetical protein